MTLALAGVLPLSSINLGLAASVAGLTAEIGALTADLSEVTAATAASVEVEADFPPNPTSLAAVVGVDLNLAEVEASLTPGNVAASGIDLSASIAADIGILEGQIAIVEGLRGQLAGALEAGGIAGFSYAGAASGFGPELSGRVVAGFGGLAPGDPVSGIVIATQGFSSWQTFSKSVSTGAPTAPAAPTDRNLVAMGNRSGGGWNTGTASLLVRFDSLLADLRGKRSALEASLRLVDGLELPDPQVIFDAAEAGFASVGIDGLLDNLVNVNADITGGINGIHAKIDAVVSLQSDISGQLSTGGFAFWGYSGRADRIGAELAAALTNGIPGGSGPGAVVYGLVLAGAAPSMDLFGGVFKTAA